MRIEACCRRTATVSIGVLKRDFRDRSRSTEAIAATRVLKKALDPMELLNPGKVLA